MKVYVPIYGYVLCEYCRDVEKDEDIKTLGVFSSEEKAIRTLLQELIVNNHFIRETFQEREYDEDIIESFPKMSTKEFEDYLYNRHIHSIETESISIENVLEKLKNLLMNWGSDFENCKINIFTHTVE